MLGRRYHDASLQLPALKLGDACSLEEALLDRCAYIVDEQNNSTAVSQTRDGKDMQVTFFLARPPRISYFCVCCTNGKPTEFGSEPKMVVTEGNLALISLTHGSPFSRNNRTKHDYYVYRAPVGDVGRPMLKRILVPDAELFLHNHPAYYFHNGEVGLLRYRTNSDDTPTLRRHCSRNDFDGYMIATLRTWDTSPDRYNLYTYDSQTETWDRKPAALADQQYQHQVESHQSRRVITIGGDAGTMGWIDLERGILLCDVLGGKEDIPTRRLLRYITLPEWEPEPIQPDNNFCGTSPRYRNIAAVQGHIKYVELRIHVRPGSCGYGKYISDGWTAVRWSRPATSGDDSGWHKDCELRASEIIAPEGMARLLPTLPPDNFGEATTTTLERLHVGYPTLSLDDDSDVVHFMAKVDEKEEEAWVIAIDMKKKTLEGVAEFAARARYSMEFTYIPTTISKYLTPGTKGMKRPGMLLPRSSSKKLLPAIPLMSMRPRYGSSSGQKLQNAQVERGNDGDDMDLA